MRYVILRDDDTNALTPVECLEQLYRPWLARDLPVNLATIPAVRTDAQRSDGRPEGFLFFGRRGEPAHTVPIGTHAQLVDYLRGEPRYHVVQHGYDHSFFEFDAGDAHELSRRLDHGARLLADAGFPPSETFVAPYDKFSRAGLRAAARRFRVISSGWFELRRVPVAWWPAYVGKKFLRQAHWRAGPTLLLTHPGCLLSCFRPRVDMLERVKAAVTAQQLTVLVTHWWEYFPDGWPDREFIAILHRVAEHLAAQRDVRVITFADLAQGRVTLEA
jgi:hypothetical protein